MNPGCRVMVLFLVLLALLPGALWLHLHYFSIAGCRRCGDDPAPR